MSRAETTKAFTRQEAVMFEKLKSLFRKVIDPKQCGIIREKLGRRILRPVEEAHEIADLLPQEALRLGVDGITDSEMLVYWKDRVQPTLISLVDSKDSHLTSSWSSSEVLLQPGSAEVFAPFRPHPADEFKARHARTTQNQLPLITRRKPPTFVRAA
jgi:hypothetical protein